MMRILKKKRKRLSKRLRREHFCENFPEKKLLEIEFKRDSVISLYLAGTAQVAIVRALQHLNVNKSFVSRTIARYRDTGSVARRQGSNISRNGSKSKEAT